MATDYFNVSTYHFLTREEAMELATLGKKMDNVIVAGPAKTRAHAVSWYMRNVWQFPPSIYYIYPTEDGTAWIVART